MTSIWLLSWFFLAVAKTTKKENPVNKKLLDQYEEAYDSFLKCRQSSELLDNIVSSTHWLYMIQRRLGNSELANELLETC
jgi:hypothetical protein